MKFSEMICHHPRTNRLDFGSDQVIAQGQGQKRSKIYFCHNTQFSSDSYETNAKMFTFQFPFSDRSKVKVMKRSKTYFGCNMLSFCPIHMKPMPKGSLFNSLYSNRSKVKVTKRSKTYFGHNTLSFRPVHVKPTPKGSLLNSLSSDRSRSRSRKGQKHILVVTRSVFVRFI